MQASGGVDKNHVGIARLGRSHGIEDNGCRVGAGFLLDDFHAIAMSPNFELFDRCGAKSVRCAKHDVQVLLAQPVRELPDARGFSRSIDSYDKNNSRLFVAICSGQILLRSIRSLQDTRDVRFDLAFQLRSVGQSVAIQFFFYGFQNFTRGFDAEIRRKQRRFQVSQRRWIDLLFTQKNIIDRL